MNTDAQTQLILRHLTKHKTITTHQAYDLYGITRLPSRIFDLREMGHKIGMVWEYGVNRYGHPVKFGKYYIEKLKGKRNV